MDAPPVLVDPAWAYHVTSIAADNIGGIPSSPQHIDAIEMTTNGVAFFCGDIGNEENPCVYLATTLYNGGLPTISIYPKGGVSGSRYWRARIPLSLFNEYRIRAIPSGYNPQKQVVFCSTLADNQKYAGYEDITDLANNGLLFRDEGNIWHVNEYNNQDTKYFVNVAVLHPIQLPPRSADGNRYWNLSGQIYPVWDSVVKN